MKPKSYLKQNNHNTKIDIHLFDLHIITNTNCDSNNIIIAQMKEAVSSRNVWDLTAKFARFFLLGLCLQT